MTTQKNNLIELAEKARPLLECEHRANRPNDRVVGERIVGFVIDQNDIGLGLSEPLVALEAMVQLAKHGIEAANQLETYEAALEMIEAGHGCPSAVARNALTLIKHGDDGGR